MPDVQKDGGSKGSVPEKKVEMLHFSAAMSGRNMEEAFLNIAWGREAFAREVCREELQSTCVVECHGGFHKAHAGGLFQDEIEGLFGIEHALTRNFGAELIVYAHVDE